MWKSDTRFPNLHISRFPHSKAPSMSFLDRFKIQPKYKSTDPDVRLAAVREYGEGPVTDEDRVAIAALAREDADPRVRRAAAGRVDDVEVLAAIASGDADEGIRGEVLERLAGMAVSSTAVETALTSLSALRDQKQIGIVAKSSPIDSIRVEAVSRLTDVKALSSVARHAADARVALLAVERVQDSAELLNIAAKTEHKDAGIAALERLESLRSHDAGAGGLDRATLDQLADRASNKSVGKRARAMVQAIDEAAAAAKTAAEQHAQRITAAIASAQALGSGASDPGAADRLAAVEDGWHALVAGATHDVSAADRVRFESAVRTARDAIERDARARAERE